MTQKLDLDPLSQGLQNALKPERAGAEAAPDLPRSQAFIFTPETISQILSFIEAGCSETDACHNASVLANSWRCFKSKHPHVKQAVLAARKVAIRRKIEERQRLSQELASMRKSARNAKRPVAKKLPRDMELVKWRLTSKVSLDIVDLDRAIVEAACNHFGVS